MKHPAAIVVLVAAVAAGVCSCNDRPPLMRDFDAWWDSLPGEERERILRIDSVPGEEQYRVHLSGKEDEDEVMVKYKEWVNKLTPAQIEAYLLHRATKGQANITSAGDVINRVSVCSGMMVVSSDCEHANVTPIGGGRCLRCVDGLSKERR